MADITPTATTDTNNHLRYDYNVDDIFLDFPTKQVTKTIVNGTASERIVKAGTLCGLTTADQTIADASKSDGSDGTEVPILVLLYDTVIPAGASEEVEALFGMNGSIFEDKVVLEGAAETLDTVITASGSIVEGQSIKNALMNSNANIKLIPAATNVSDYKDAQV
jgi:hypothetical protein